MPDGTLSPIEQEAKAAARGEIRQLLGRSQTFAAMPVTEQQALYTSLVKDEYTKQLSKRGVEPGNGVSQSMATDSGKDMGYKGYDPAFKEDTRSFKDLVDTVDFPKFVADLLKAVFDANLVVMKQQTDSYIKLMKECTKSSADFIKQIKDEESFARLAEHKGDKYNVTTEKGADGSMKLALTNPGGDKVDVEDAEVKKDILEEKINMAKEHRAALREVLLMGVTRLVVNKGQVEAAVDFSVNATRKSDAHHDDTNTNVTSHESEFTSPAGGFLGGASGSFSMVNTNIQVNTSDKHTGDELQAKLHGKVNIEFKTDYFKLDNFANMYSDGGTQALKSGSGGQQALPAGR